jgi:NADPH:quinone reductase
VRAIVQYEFGPADNLRYEETKDPRPGPDQVRVAVSSAGIHLLDTSIRKGLHGGPFPLPTLPMTPGREVAGVVDELGGGVDERWLGKRVVAHLGQASGGYAELAVANVAALHELPDGLSEDAAVAMIGTGRTTMGILENAGLTAEDVVLVTAAAGGIGNLLIQEARNVGAVSIGVAGGMAKVDAIRRLGASVAVDYNRPEWMDAVRGELDGRPVTIVLDGVGGQLGRDALELIGPGGRLLIFGWSSGQILPLSAEDLYRLEITAGAAIGRRVLGRLRELEDAALEAATSSRLVPLIGPPFPLAGAAQAHIALETRATIGKVVLKP